MRSSRKAVTTNLGNVHYATAKISDAAISFGCDGILAQSTGKPALASQPFRNFDQNRNILGGELAGCLPQGCQIIAGCAFQSGRQRWFTHACEPL